MSAAGVMLRCGSGLFHQIRASKSRAAEIGPHGSNQDTVLRYHHDAPPAAAAEILGGKIVFSEARKGQWVVVIEMRQIIEADATYASGDRSVSSRSTRQAALVAGVAHRGQPE